jgi:hypothetical protein
MVFDPVQLANIFVGLITGAVFTWFSTYLAHRYELNRLQLASKLKQEEEKNSREQEELDRLRPRLTAFVQNYRFTPGPAMARNEQLSRWIFTAGGFDEALTKIREADLAQLRQLADIIPGMWSDASK